MAFPSEVSPVRKPIKPRNPPLQFEGIPRRWFAGLALPTHVSNGVNLLFPMGERFFVRSVRHFEKRIADDPALLAAVRGFYGQESKHAGAHEAFFEVLEAQGFEIEGFLEVYRRIAYDGFEKVLPPELRLSATAAAEHFTAIMAEDALRHRFLDFAHPTMKQLLLWHAAEEIEHKSVAFDVLMRVNPGYGLRIAGLGLATLVLASFWAAATIMMLKQDNALSLESLRELREVEERNQRPRRTVARDVFWKGIKAYLRPDFHPSQVPMDDLADAYLAEAGLA